MDIWLCEIAVEHDLLIFETIRKALNFMIEMCFASI